VLPPRAARRADPAQELDGDGLMRLCTSPRARVLRCAASESESEREKAERAPRHAGLRTSAAPAHEEAEGRHQLAREIGAVVGHEWDSGVLTLLLPGREP